LCYYSIWSLAGIIVDTFVSLREETDSRNEICDNVVFVSGVTREKCTEANVSFEDHQNVYQNTWNYVFFIAYLKEKNKDDLDGAEFFVWNCVQNEDNQWFPRMRSLILDNTGTEQDEEEGDQLNRVEGMLGNLLALLQSNNTDHHH
jgi:hypothetical protein